MLSDRPPPALLSSSCICRWKTHWGRVVSVQAGQGLPGFWFYFNFLSATAAPRARRGLPGSSGCGVSSLGRGMQGIRLGDGSGRLCP